jgi:hypothetical protein
MAQLNEQFLRMQKLAGVITESQYNKKMQMLNEEITVGETYTASMPTSSDGKERMDIKVKVLGVDRNDNNRFIVTPLEDKDYTNPVSKQLNSFEKGKQYGVEAEFIKESLNEENEFNAASYFSAMDSDDPNAKSFIQNIKKVADSDLSKRSTIINKLKDHAKANPEVKGKLDAAIEFINS